MKRTGSAKPEIHPESHSSKSKHPPPDSTTGCGVEDDSKNPMLNPVILRHLFELIPFNCREFKNFRQVSKLWFETSLRRWRQEAWLHVRDGNRRDDNPTLFYKPFLEMLRLPGDPYQLLGNYAFQKYKLSSTYNACVPSKFFREDALLPFWSKVGPLLTHLKVVETNLGSGELVMRILLEMSPKMQFLSLEGSDVSIPLGAPLYPLTADELRRANVPVWIKRLQPEASEVQRNLTHFESTFRGRRSFGLYWMYFLLRFPNIQTFELQEIPRRHTNFWGHHLNDELLRSFETLKIVRDNGQRDILARLEHLDLLNVQQWSVNLFRPKILTLVSQLAFLLASLSLDIGFEQDLAGFRRILRLYSSTLKKLVVYCGSYTKPLTQNFPYGVALTNLEELKLIGPICGNLHFLEKTPSLNTLVLLDGQTPMEPEVLHSYVDFSLHHQVTLKELSSKLNIVSSSNFSSGSLKNLTSSKMEEFIIGHELCNGAQVEALGKLMPGLKKRIGLGNEGFKAVCKNLTQLRYLDIEPFDVEEEGILGMNDGQKYSQPNIMDLKCRFEFTSNGCTF